MSNAGERTPGIDWRAMPEHHLAAASNGVPRRVDHAFEDLVLSTTVVEDLLQEVVRTAAASVGGDVSVAITLAIHDRPATLAATDDDTAEFDEVQSTLDEGPTLTAMRTRTAVLIEDLAEDERFDQYRPRALALGVRSCLSLPLDGGNRSVGALTLYSRQASAFGFRERSQARRLADGASRMLNLALVLAERIELTGQLRDAMTARTLIDEATGIVMYQYQCTSEAAFELLTDASRDRNVPLAVLALQVTIAASGKPPTDGFPFQPRPLT